MKYIIFLFRAIWLALSLLILFFSMHRLSLLDSTRDVSELISLMSYGMMVICFPNRHSILYCSNIYRDCIRHYWRKD
ncbi:inner membrane protein [Escherichia coli]|uniref:Inner membrane protein n=1 Tax=Escherichia coli TaxID=562 RepID=A0AAX2KES2_ECOLX|nr:inner membrane protein [Escherichia coli]